MTTTTRKATARLATKLTMMATMTTVATNGDNNDGNGMTSNGATGYEEDDDSDGR